MLSNGSLADQGLRVPSSPAHFSGKSVSLVQCLANVLFSLASFALLFGVSLTSEQISWSGGEL